MESKTTTNISEKLHDGHWTVIDRLKRGKSYVHPSDTPSQARIYTHCFNSLKHWGLVDEAKLSQSGYILFHEREYERKRASWKMATAAIALAILLPLTASRADDSAAWQTTPDGTMTVSNECFCGPHDLVVRGSKASEFYVGAVNCFDTNEFTATRGIPLTKMQIVATSNCFRFFIATSRGKVRVLKLREF